LDDIQAVTVDTRIHHGINGLDRKSLHLVRGTTDDRLEIAEGDRSARRERVTIQLDKHRRTHVDLDITIRCDSHGIARGIIRIRLNHLLRAARRDGGDVGS
jgi:hypothetical protein